jgi:hypothetical protein
MTGATRGADGQFIKTLKGAQRDAAAAELRARGWSFQRIAGELGFPAKGNAHHAVERAFAAIPTEGSEEAKRLDLERIDRLIEQAWDVMERRHVVVSDGRVVGRQVGVERDDNGIERLDLDGKTIPVYEDILDDGPVLQAIDRLSRLLERRAKIIGYEAPRRHRVEVITEDAVDAEIARLAAEVGERDRDYSGTT